MVKVFAVFDSKAAAFGTPMFIPNKGIALRSFSDVCADPKSPLCQHPADYSLFELGEYEANSGELKPHDKPLFLFSASDVVQQLIAARTSVVAPAEVSR